MAFHPQGRVVGALAVKTPHHWQMVGIRLRLGGSNVLPRHIKEGTAACLVGVTPVELVPDTT